MNIKLTANNNLKRIEDYLSSKLHPVVPNPGFIQRLKNQLHNARTVLVEKKNQTITYFFVVVGIVVGAVFLLLLGKPKTKK